LLASQSRYGGTSHLKRILVLGGYGTFGARISELLGKAKDIEVLVGGRSLEKAKVFCRSRADLNLTAVHIDRDKDLEAILHKVQPWLVVDAAGPFQEASYHVARACMSAGSHYLDIADGRSFVERFSDLDVEARAAGLTIISGASSVPALSSAVTGRLAQGLDAVGLVETAISASHRATVGLSVMQAILSYVGKAVALKQSGRVVSARGWRSLRRQTFVTSRTLPLKRRWVAICDVPDLALLAERTPGQPLVIFRAGAELGLENWALWMLSWLVQWGLIADLRPLASVLLRLRRLTSRLGGDRSAMSVRLVGLRGEQVIERTWTLIADNGQGPFTPCLAAPLLARRLANGVLPIGAYAAVGLLSLDDFEPDFKALGFDTEINDLVEVQPLYRRVMGEAFHRLPTAVRKLHILPGSGLAEGRATVTRGTNPISLIVARIFSFPSAGRDIPVSVRFSEHSGLETWERRFGDASFSSQLSQMGDLLVERFGVMRFGFELLGTPNGLSMNLRRWWIGPLPMPLALGPSGVALESGANNRFHFEVPISAPFIGLIVRYEGWLAPVADPGAGATSN